MTVLSGRGTGLPVRDTVDWNWDRGGIAVAGEPTKAMDDHRTESDRRWGATIVIAECMQVKPELIQTPDWSAAHDWRHRETPARVSSLAEQTGHKQQTR